MGSKLFRKKQFKIVIQGLDGAGRSTIFQKIKAGKLTPNFRTDGLIVETTDYKNLHITLYKNIPDVIMVQYYKFNGCDGIIFIVDSNDKDRLKDSNEKFRRILCLEEINDCRCFF